MQSWAGELDLEFARCAEFALECGKVQQPEQIEVLSGWPWHTRLALEP